MKSKRRVLPRSNVDQAGRPGSGDVSHFNGSSESKGVISHDIGITCHVRVRNRQRVWCDQQTIHLVKYLQLNRARSIPVRGSNCDRAGSHSSDEAVRIYSCDRRVTGCPLLNRLINRPRILIEALGDKLTMEAGEQAFSSVCLEKRRNSVAGQLSGSLLDAHSQSIAIGAQRSVRRRVDHRDILVAWIIDHHCG